jgi:Mrp family chromosome partitioning ATPase
MSVSKRRDPNSGNSTVAEAYRILRSSVKFATGGRPVRSVLVVDVDRAQPSGVAEQLARSFADAGDRCVLVETDVRRGSDTPGFTDLVLGTATMDAVVRIGAQGEPSWIGPGSAAVPDALAGKQLAPVVDALTEGYDVVVLSSAPLPAFGDAVSIAPHVDATILIVTSGRTRRPRAVEARDALERVGARLLGVVMVETKRRWFW